MTDTPTPEAPLAGVLTTREISHDEAEEIAQRLINSHFRQEPGARISIPARPHYDDDLLLKAYIEQCRYADAHAESVAKARLAMNRESVMRALYCSDDFDLDQSSTGNSFDAILKQVRDGAPHDGDCTNQAHTCFVCLIAELETRADAFIAAYDARPAPEPEGREFTQEMIERGIAALGNDGDRNSAEIVVDVYRVMRAAPQPETDR